MRALWLVVALAACKPDVETLTGLPNEPGGNPVVPDVALYPWPSDFYLEDDASTLTGRHVALDQDALPEGVVAESFADDDGFSRMIPILTTFREGIDPSTLPSYDESLTASASVMLVRTDTLALHPILAEPDLHARGAFEQALIIRPALVMDENAPYAVIITDDLKGEDGVDITPTDAFRALRDDIPTDSNEVESQRADYVRVFEAIDGLGIDRERVVQAWGFHTRSDEQVTRPTLSMHDQMYAANLGTAVIDYTETHNGLHRFFGRVEVPDFMGEDLVIELDENGDAVQRGTREIAFIVAVPEGITEPRPTMAYGHGFFSNKEETTRSLREGLIRWQINAVAIDFHGFNEDEEGETILKLTGPLAEIDGVVAQQMQAQAEFTAVARLIEEQLEDLIVIDGDVHPIDGTDKLYMGISNGGTQGLAITSASPAFDRGVLVVPGGGWTHMLQRAVQWNTMGLLFSARYDDPRVLQAVVSLIQNRFDPADSINYVEHLVHDRYEGRKPFKATLHEAVHDSQVANLVTHMVARTAGVSLVTPSPVEVWGLETTAADAPGAAVDGALLLYAEDVEPAPEGNLPPTSDNGTHGTVRKLDSYQQQVGEFLETGAIIQVCDGACDPE